MRFPGKYYDAETGLHYNYFRDYNPVIGRYVEADLIGIEKGKNHLYVYTDNNPINFKDPNGLCKWTGSLSIFGGGEIVGGAIFIMPLQSECCNCKKATGVYIAVAGGGSLGVLPVQASAGFPLSLNGPDTPCETDPVGAFNFFSATYTTAWGASLTTLKTGSLLADFQVGWQGGIDIGIDLMFGYTIKIDGRTIECSD